MGYQWLADVVVILHFAFLLFAVLGGLAAFRWRWVPWIHLPAAIWGGFVEVTGRVCPLTVLENWLRRAAGGSGYERDFIDRYVVPIVYPSGLTREMQLALGALLVAVNGAIYLIAWRGSTTRHARVEGNTATRLPMVSLVVTGLLGPIWFIALVIVQGILQPDYSHIAMPISALAAWPAGWMQNLNFFVFGTLTAAFTIGVHHAIRPTRFGVVGIVLLLASCVGVVMAGLFPWINVNGVPTETQRHVVGAVVAFACAGAGLLILSRRMAADPHWRSLSCYVLATGIVMLLLFIAVGAFAIDEGTPLHRWAGFLQRVLVAVWFACIMVMANRALRLAR